MRNFLAACAATLMAADAGAQIIGVNAPPPAEARLLSGFREPGAHVAGLEIILAPGWKTYWRVPGEAGIPPSFDWTGSRNVKSVEVVFPAPEAFESYGMVSYGYHHGVVMPLRVIPENPAEPVSLRLGLDYGVCKDVCVFARADLGASLDPVVEEGRVRIEEARARAPVSAAEAGALAIACGVSGAGEHRRFGARIAFRTAPAATPGALIVEGPESLWVGPATVSMDGDVMVAEAEAQLWDQSAWIARDSLRITVIGPDGAFEAHGCEAL